MSKGKPMKTIRCAVYTRKSTEEGLEKEFNSLDAQRESGENYIKAQIEEGWVCLPDRYDDGGFSGGNMELPALKRLLADIEAGKVDSVIVYKVDRLSRSLLDFAKMVETFDRKKVSFVSVTQLINTSTSMGRLMLNVLLSFAQFEREIISERTRDKIAAARRKGKWSGGMPLLGYDVDPRGSKLIVNEDEAIKVRTIFELYLEHQSLIATIAELDRRGWINKRWITRKGTERGGRPFNKDSLHCLLTNVTYLGKLRYKNEINEGEHAAIVSADIWQRVQGLLGRNGRNGGADARNKFGALLKGILRCVPCGCAMGRRPQAPRLAHDQLVYAQPEVLYLQFPLAIPANAERTVPGAQPHPEHRLRTRREQPHCGVVSRESSDAVGGDRRMRPPGMGPELMLCSLFTIRPHNVIANQLSRQQFIGVYRGKLVAVKFLRYSRKIYGWAPIIK